MHKYSDSFQSKPVIPNSTNIDQLRTLAEELEAKKKSEIKNSPAIKPITKRGGALSRGKGFRFRALGTRGGKKIDGLYIAYY